MKETDAAQKRLAGLDGIRLWGITLIVAEHTGLIPENGAVGVALCFVLSGFLSVFAGNSGSPEDLFLKPVNWIKYYVRRIFRILPMYYLCIFYFWFFHPDICFGSWEAVWNHLIFRECGVHFWYLQQEVLMYVFTPVIFLGLALIGKLLRRFGIKAEWIFIVLLLVTAFFAKRQPLIYLHGNGALQPFRIYLYLMGMATGYFCRIVREKQLILQKTTGNVLVLIGNLWILAAFLITLLSAPIFLIHFGIDLRNTYYSVVMDIPFGVTAMLWIIAAVFCRRGIVAKFFGNPVFAHLSVRSYGIYLFHFLLRIDLQVQDGIMMFLMDMFLSICISEVLYALVEKPLGDFGKHLSPKKLGSYYKTLFSLSS